MRADGNCTWRWHLSLSVSLSLSLLFSVKGIKCQELSPLLNLFLRLSLLSKLADAKCHRRKKEKTISEYPQGISPVDQFFIASFVQPALRRSISFYSIFFFFFLFSMYFLQDVPCRYARGRQIEAKTKFPTIKISKVTNYIVKVDAIYFKNGTLLGNVNNVQDRVKLNFRYSVILHSQYKVKE